MNIIPIKQRDGSACGPSCIQMALEYFRIPHTWKDIVRISKYKKRDGLSNKDLVETLRLFPVHVKEKANATWNDMQKSISRDQIIIVSWMKHGYIGHFSIVKKVNEKSIILIDPEIGQTVKMDRVVFMRLWMDYDDMWYPRKNTDIQLRWMCAVNNKKSR